jgi:CRP-like cAMP-binding protein
MAARALNRLLAAMPADVADELMESGGDFHVEAGCLLPKAACDGSQLFIITEGVAALLAQTPAGRTMALGLVGNEGILPLAGLLNVPANPASFFALIGPLAGRRVRTKDFWRIVGESPEAMMAVNRFLYAQMLQSVDTMLVNDLPVAARLARSLVMFADRTEGAMVTVTHDRLALLLHAHRPTITAEIRSLRDAGLIDTGRGSIKIVDRDGLLALVTASGPSSPLPWPAAAACAERAPEAMVA